MRSRLLSSLADAIDTGKEQLKDVVLDIAGIDSEEEPDEMAAAKARERCLRRGIREDIRHYRRVRVLEPESTVRK